jgi:RNA polymerase-binding transcription factor DksA
MNEETVHKQALEAELEELTSELKKLGIQNPLDSDEWDVTPPEFDILSADENEVADKNEELHVRSLILDELSVRYKNVHAALQKIEQGTYGLCEVDGNPIEEERLLANPAARTCKAHLEESDHLDD